MRPQKTSTKAYVFAMTRRVRLWLCLGISVVISVRNRRVLWGSARAACLFSGLILVASASDSGLIVINPTNRTVTTSNFFVAWNTGKDVEAITTLKWAGGQNMTGSGALDTCGPEFPGAVEYMGNSYAPPDPESGGLVLVGGGTTTPPGTTAWSGQSLPSGTDQVTINSSSTGCRPSSAGINVKTIYSFFNPADPSTTWFGVQRAFDFTATTFAHNFRPYMPRLSLGEGFTQVLYPTTSGTLATMSVYDCGGGCTGPVVAGNAAPLNPLWDATRGWFAIHNPGTLQGVVVKRNPSADPQGKPITAQLWVDNDALSSTNASSFLLMSPTGGFKAGLVTEVETLCFYDSSIWTPSLTPPAACSSSLPNTWYVNGVSGSDSNDCKLLTTACKTIGHAISLAGSGGTIRVAAGTYYENLTISVNLKVIGSGHSTTIIDGSESGLDYGAPVVTITNTAHNVVLSDVTIRNGSFDHGEGGGIYSYSSGALTINCSWITGNTVTFEGGGIYNQSQSATLTINGSTISGNTAGYGTGGISFAGKVTINKSTISGNSCIEGCTGGGIYSGPLVLNNSTVTGNDAIEGGGIFATSAMISNSTITGNSAVPQFGGGGIYVGNGGAKLQNTIVAGNSGGNCGGTMTSLGFNLSSDNTCNFTGPGDMNNTDPKLGPLGNHGGSTQTMLLLKGSPAIDAGNPSGCTDNLGHLLKTDQRGAPRPDKEDTGGCDIGAVERQSD